MVERLNERQRQAEFDEVSFEQLHDFEYQQNDYRVAFQDQVAQTNLGQGLVEEISP